MYPIHFSCFLFPFSNEKKKHTSLRSILIFSFRQLVFLYLCMCFISIWFMAHLNQRSKKQKQQPQHGKAKVERTNKKKQPNQAKYTQKIRSFGSLSFCSCKHGRARACLLLPSWSPQLFFNKFLNTMKKNFNENTCRGKKYINHHEKKKKKKWAKRNPKSLQPQHFSL